MPIDPTGNAQLAASGATAQRADGMAARLRAAALRGDSKALEEAARSFESYFAHEMLSEMRATTHILGEGLFDSSAMDTFTEQLDMEVAERVAAGRGLGLARMIVTSMQGRAAAERLGQDMAPAETGAIARPGFSWPLPGSQPGRISSDFGNREHPTLSGVHHHAGLDLAAPAGTPVLAARAGVVTRAEEAGAYGLLVELDHGDGIVTRYAHQSVIDVAVGDRVEAGERLGAVGSSGRATGDHLHLEVRVEGRAVDPLEFLGSR